MRLQLLLLSSLFLGLSACVPHQDTPEPGSGSADFSRVIVLGGSELSGYQDGALYHEGQSMSVGALVAKQLQLAGGGAFMQADMPEGVSFGLNKRWESRFLEASHLGDRTDCKGVVSLGPVRDTVSETELTGAGVWANPAANVQDFAIPFMRMADLASTTLGTNPTLDGPHPFAARYAFASQGKSVLDAVLEQDPSFFLMWPGMADVWEWARNGGHGVSLTADVVFRTQLDATLATLTGNGAKGVLATIPDIGYFPYFTTIPARGLNLTAALADSLNDIYGFSGVSVNFQEGANGFVVGDASASNGFRQLQEGEYITLSVPLDSMKCYYLGVLFQLMPDRYSLIQSELTELRSAIQLYNATIRELANTYGLAVVEMEPFFQDLDSGLRFDAVDFTTEFVSGGFFSLDGWHANPKGAGMLANEFISAINTKYAATVPPVQLHQLRGVLFP